MTCETLTLERFKEACAKLKENNAQEERHWYLTQDAYDYYKSVGLAGEIDKVPHVFGLGRAMIVNDEANAS